MVLGNTLRPDADKVAQIGVGHRVGIDVNFLDRLQQDPGINFEEGTDARQDIRSRKTLTREVAVKLCAVDIKLACKIRDRPGAFDQLSQVCSKYLAQLSRGIAFVGQIECSVMGHVCAL